MNLTFAEKNRTTLKTPHWCDLTRLIAENYQQRELFGSLCRSLFGLCIENNHDINSIQLTKTTSNIEICVVPF